MVTHPEHAGREHGPVHGHSEATGFRLSWGAIFAGLVVAMVVQILLALLGLAIGFGTIDFQGGTGLGGIGVGAGIWAVVTALISLFVGGMAAGHLAGVLTRFDGVMHGVLVWGLSTIVALWTLSAGVSTILGGMFGVAGQTLSAAVGGVGQIGAAAVERVEELPAAPANRQEMVAILQRQGLTSQQAENAASQIERLGTDVQLQAEQIQRQAPAVATQVAGSVSTAVWWILLASVLSLAAAAGGAAVTAEE